MVYPFEERSALQRAISEVIFSGVSEKWVYFLIFEFYGGEI